VPAAVKTQPSRTGLTAEQVARAALDFLDRNGLEALSMRRLAAELGVGAMTLYGYYRSKEELLDAVVDVAVAGARPRVDGAAPWREQLTALMRGARRAIGRHPALGRLRATRPVLRPEALRFGEASMAVLRGAGFDDRAAALSFRLLFTYVFGFVTFSPAEHDRQAAEEAAGAIRALPPDAYPNLTEAASDMAAAMGGDEAFEYGLARILDGLEAALTA
jgi:AcrR family transcriptional regulator